MPDTTQQVIAGIYVLLPGVGDLKLHPDDVLELLNDELRGRIQDLDLGGREQRTATAEVDIDEDDVDYTIRLPGVPDFEAVRLEFGGVYTGTIQAWQEVAIVTGAAWSSHYDGNRVAASFYGGIKVKLNIDPGSYEWRLTYRLPLLNIVQTGERPPIPSNFLPLLKIAVAIRAMRIVKDHTEEWKSWVKDTTPVYAADLLRWEMRWDQYVNSSVEPATQEIRPFNSFRRVRGRNTRAYLPISS